MKIIRTYVLKEHLGPFLVTGGGLTAVLLLGNIVKFADLIITKGVSFFDVLRLIIYLIPYVLSFTIPMACLIAMVMAFSRLNTDYELIAMRASGVAPARLLGPALTTALVVSLLVMVFSDRVVPESHLAFRRQLKAIGIKNPTAYLEAGTFIKAFVPYVIFVYQLEGKTLVDVRIYEPQPNGPTRTIVASRGTLEPLPDERGIRLLLQDGHIDQWDPQHPGSLYKVAFNSYTMTMTTGADSGKRLDKKIKEMTFRELAWEERDIASQGVSTVPIQIERHHRIASSFATLVFVLYGLSLGLAPHHHERLITFIWVLGVFMVYYLLTIGTIAIAMKEWLPAAAAMWIPNTVVGSFGAVRTSLAVRR